MVIVLKISNGLSPALARVVVTAVSRELMVNSHHVVNDHIVNGLGGNEPGLGRVPVKASRARLYSAFVLQAFYPNAPPNKIARMVGVQPNMAKYYLRRHRGLIDRGKVPWWSDKLFLSIVEQVERNYGSE